MIEVYRLSDSKVRIFPLELIGTGAGINCRKQKVGWLDGSVLSGSKGGFIRNRLKANQKGITHDR